MKWRIEIWRCPLIDDSVITDVFEVDDLNSVFHAAIVIYRLRCNEKPTADHYFNVTSVDDKMFISFAEMV